MGEIDPLSDEDWLDATLKEGRKWRTKRQKKKKKSVAWGNVAIDTDDDEMEEATAGSPRVTVWRAVHALIRMLAARRGAFEQGEEMSRIPLQQPLVGSVARCGTSTVSVINPYGAGQVIKHAF